jgi:hypothetical protein
MKSKQSIGFYQKIIYRFLSLLLIFQYHVCEQCTVNITASFVGRVSVIVFFVEK